MTYPDGTTDNATAKFELDTDGDGTPDSKDDDDDNDGVTDEVEKDKGSNPKDPSDKPSEDKAPDWNDGSTTPGKKVELPNVGGDVQDGTTVETEGPGKAEIDEDGDLVVTPNDDAKPGDKITVVVKDKDGKVIDTVTVTIKEKDGSSDGGSSDGGVDLGRCIPAGLAVGLPLLFLIPVGLASQIKVPGMSPFIEQITGQIGKANIELQKQLGIYNPAIAQQVSAINAQFGKYGEAAGKVAGGIALVAAGALAIGLLADACSPKNSSSSKGSSNGSSNGGSSFGGSSK